MPWRLDDFRTDREIHDTLNVELAVAGSIVIPRLRHALETIEMLRTE